MDTFSSLVTFMEILLWIIFEVYKMQKLKEMFIPLLIQVKKNKFDRLGPVLT